MCEGISKIMRNPVGRRRVAEWMIMTFPPLPLPT
jgi:hypothetical protein